MRPISKEGNKRTYLVNFLLSLILFLAYLWKGRRIFIILALIFFLLALYRMKILDKILK